MDHMVIFFFLSFFSLEILFIYLTEREREKERARAQAGEQQAEGEAGSQLSKDPGIMT